MDDIQKADIFEIKRSFIESNTSPHLGEIIELEDNNKIRSYIFKENNNWYFLKEEIINNEETPENQSIIHSDFNNENKIKTDSKIISTKGRKKKSLIDELKNILSLIEINDNKKAILNLKRIINEKLPLIKENDQKPKKPRIRSEYNHFISRELIQIKTDNPNMTPPERMREAVRKYHEYIENNKVDQ